MPALVSLGYSLHTSENGWLAFSGRPSAIANTNELREQASGLSNEAPRKNKRRPPEKTEGRRVGIYLGKALPILNR